MERVLSGRAEDYLRSIYEVVEQKGFARIKDIAKELELKPSTVVEMIRKLHKSGFVRYERYGGVTLTPHGREIAQAIKERHDTFKKFLELLLIPEDIVLKDSHILEHQLDPKTILQFTRFIKFVTEVSSTLIEQFKEYCKREEEKIHSISVRKLKI